MSTPSLATLLVRESKEAIYRTALNIATIVGVDTSSWRAGDPTRSLYHLESEILSKLEDVVVGFIQSDYLDLATGMWLKLLAKQKFNVDVPDATYATTDIVLTNNGGGIYDYDPLDIQFASRLTGKTYHNTTGGNLPRYSGVGDKPTLTLTIEADEPGSDSSAVADEIVIMTNGDLGVTCTNPTAAVGLDEQDEDTTRQQCRDKLGSLSPNGPRDAYSYVAKNKDLTTVANITRTRAIGDSDTGDLYLYVAGPSGTVSAPDLALIELAILKWATPLCITPHVAAAVAIEVDIEYELWLYKSVNATELEVLLAVETALEKLFAKEAIGGDVIPPSPTGRLFKSHIEGAILGTFEETFRVIITTPSGDTALTINEVPVLGSVIGVINFVEDP